MTNTMIYEYLQQRRFQELWDEGVLGAWEITYAYCHGLMTDEEVIMYSEMLLNI